MMKSVIAFFRRVIVGFVTAKCSLHAAGLTYFSMLAVVPVLCVLLFSAKICNVDRYARAQIDSRIDAMIANVEKGQDDAMAEMLPADRLAREQKRAAAVEFGTEARKIANTVFERIDKFDISTFGWIGFGMLLWTVVSTLSMVEATFNAIWGVTKGRAIWKCAYLYLFIAIVVPIFAALALSMPVLGAVKSIVGSTLGQSALTKWFGDGMLWLLDLKVFKWAFSLTFASLAFGFFYWIMPNRPVRFAKAFCGGLVTAVAFALWLRVCAVAQVGIAKSSALYGSFAFFPIVLAWVYISWEIVLLGETIVMSLHGDEPLHASGMLGNALIHARETQGVVR